MKNVLNCWGRSSKALPFIPRRLVICYLVFFLFVGGCFPAPIQPTSNPLLTPKPTQAIIAPTSSLETLVTKAPTPTKPPEPKLQLTYVSDQRNGYFGVYTVDFGCLNEITPCFGHPKLLFERSKDIFHLSWAPDGQRVVFTMAGSNDLYVASEPNWEIVNITNSPNQLEDWPAWSPNGQEVAHDVSAENDVGISFRYGIWSIGVNSNEPKQLLNLAKDMESARQVAWSPNGQQLAFSADDPITRKRHIYIANVDGSNLKKISQDLNGSESSTPSFSPDGQQLVFSQQTSDFRSVISLAGVNLGIDAELIDDFNSVLSPKWAPFGNWIAFTSDRYGGYDIYIIRPDGTKLIAVTKLSHSEETDPAWRTIR